ncbi:MAG TPA: ATP-binding protein [Actinomycetota bacterium]|nr:ATP-binding protein [Actinomycetota bacterium]
MATKLFDLNIEEVLENWDIHHAVREVISNALDERSLTGTADIEIAHDGPRHWRIRDHGRGLEIRHFTLKENEEKLARSEGVIGKFGVGLKDALATFQRRGVGVTIRSRHGTFRLREAEKHGFEEIRTLHVEFDDSSSAVEGTEFDLTNVPDEEIARAKALFIAFNEEEALETTTYGQVLRRGKEGGRVYISGVLASEEPNFLFSYNVTSLTEGMRKRLNRERLNVGRTTYAERVKSILREATSEEVLDALIQEVFRRSRGEQADELHWIEIAQKALTAAHENGRVAFVTEQELGSQADMIGHMRADGLRVVVITADQKRKLQEQAAAGGPQVRTLETYVEEFNASFEYSFVDPQDLDPRERAILALRDEVATVAGFDPAEVPPVRISETLRLGMDDTEGVWDSDLEEIVLKRATLESPERFAGVLLHEIAHAFTGTRDVSRAFEMVLTEYLGVLAARGLAMQGG